MSITPFKGQVYEELKARHSRNNLFVDSQFPATDKSMYYNQRPPNGIIWKRPLEVRRNAQFVVDGFDRCDMDQGYIGNCWFIAGCVGIMQSPTLFAKVVPQDQNFGDDYAGIFHFRFWLYGEWVDVVVDDRLPFWADGRLVFCSNKQQPAEFWAPLLEKAYAKLYGAYENLEAGQTTDALIDMSGGLQEAFDIKELNSPDEKMNLWRILFQAYHKNSIMGCSIMPDPSVKEARMANGLVRGHAYTVTKVVVLNTNGRDVRLLRIRNPWGNEVEWKGAWADGSKEWNSVGEDDKEEIGLVHEKDGEFWMSYDDFLKSWDQVQICHLSVDSFSDAITENSDINHMSWRKLAVDPSQSWKCTVYHSAWEQGKTAGGCGRSNQSKFWTNPQFLVTLNDIDKDDNESKTSVVVALMQKDSRLKRINAKRDCEEFIQFKFFKIRDSVELDEARNSGLRLYANQLQNIGSSGPYINSREVTKRFRVEPGNYLIIPSTYEEDKDCEFIVRIFTEQEIEANSLDQHKDELNEDESFFEMQDSDQMFNSWGNFMGADEEASEQSAGEEEAEETHHHSKHTTQTPKEACNMM